MSLAEVVAWVMFAVLIGWLAIVLYATFRQSCLRSAKSLNA